MSGDVVHGTFDSSFNAQGTTGSLCGAAPNYQWYNDTSVTAFVWIVGSTETCTPTINYGTSASGNALLNIAVEHGFAAYPVAFPLKGYESDTSPQSQTGITIPNFDSDDTIVSMLTEEGGTCPSQSSTFTVDSATVQTPTFSGGGCIGAQMMYLNSATSSGAPYSNSIGTSSISQMWSYYLVLRKSMPTMGEIQIQGVSTKHFGASSTLTATLPQVSTAGDLLHVVLQDTSGQISTVSPSGGVNCYPAADTANGASLIRNFQCPIPNPAPGSPVAITATPGSGSFSGDMIVSECKGCSVSQPLAASSNNILGPIDGTTSTTQTVPPVYLQQVASYFLDGFTVEGRNQTEQQSIEPASPFALLYQFQYDVNLLAYYGTVTAVAAPPSSQGYSATLGTALTPSSTLYAWADTAATYPTVIEGHPTFGTYTVTLADPENDAGVYVCGVAPNSGDWTFSPSWTSNLTTVDGCTSSKYCIAYTTAAPPQGATLAITGTPTDGYMQVEKVRSLGTLDAHSVATATGTGPVGPVNATASGTNEFAKLCGGDFGSGVGTYTIPTFNMGTSGVNTVPNLADTGETTESEAVLSSAGTYGATWATPTGWDAPMGIFGETAIFLTTVTPPPSTTSGPLLLAVPNPQ